MRRALVLFFFTPCTSGVPPLGVKLLWQNLPVRRLTQDEIKRRVVKRARKNRAIIIGSAEGQTVSRASREILVEILRSRIEESSRRGEAQQP
jgi:hypothetical protein